LDRTSAGTWLLNRFNVERFEKLDPEPLDAELMRLRALKYDWGPDAIAELLKLRHGDDEEEQANGGV
jgi:hypothetical protein